MAAPAAPAAPQDPAAVDRLITTGHYDEAARAADALARRARGAGDFGAAARALLQQSDALYYLGRRDAVDRLNHEALALAQRAGDAGAIGRALYSLSFAYERTEPARMITMLDRAVPYARQAADRRLEMHIENAYGTAYWSAGPYSAAITHFTRAGTIADALGDRHAAVIARANVALMHERRGEHDRAIREYEPVIAALRAEKAAGALAQQLGNLGIAHRSLGNLERALALFEEALQIQRENGFKRSEAVLLGDIAAAYWDLDDDVRAEAAARQALTISEAIADRRNAVSLLATLARWRVERGRFDEAAAIARDARVRADALGDPEGIAEVLTVAARAEAHRDPVLALQFVDRAAGIGRRAGDPYLIGHAYALRAELLENAGRHDAATRAWRTAIDEHQRTRTRRSLPEWHARLGHSYAALGRRDEARREFDASIRLIDDLDAVVSLDRFRITFFQDVARIFHQYASHLVEWGDPVGALAVVERGRARDLALRLAQSATADPLSDAERDALGRLTERQRMLQEGGLTAVRRAELLRDVDESEATFERARLAAGHAAPSAVVPSFDIPSSDALIVEYAVSGSELLIFSANGGHLAVRKVGDAAALLERVRRFVAAAAAPDQPPAESMARELAQTLIDPELQAAGARRLIVVADDALQYLPFGALIDDGHRFLADRFAISVTPSLTTLRELTSRRAAADRVLAVGNGRFDGTSFMGTPLPPLPVAAAEAEMVARHAAEVDLLTDVTEARVRQLELSRYGVIHFATHALIYDARPDRSCIVLARDGEQDGLLQARELYNVRLNCAMAVVSGCETARGSIVSGEGVLGLSHALFAAGARSLVLTLWKVSDRATAEFMRVFYDALARQLTIAEALGAAQHHMMTSGEWRHPAYWAGFVVAGDADQRLPLRAGGRVSRAGIVTVTVALILASAALVVWRSLRAHQVPDAR